MKKSILLAVLASAVPALYAQKAQLPNIVFILADDMGYGDISGINEQGKIPTPHLDQLAQEGVTFTDAHTTSSVSTPSRYGILTGRYNWRSRLKRGIVSWYGKPLMSPDRTSMASMLRSQGYRTACMGKWHLGFHYPTTDGKRPVDTPTDYNLDFKQAITGGPCDVGFDYFFGVDCPNFPPYCFIENRHTLGMPVEYYPVSRQMDYRPGRGLKGWQLEKVLPTVVDKATEYIRKSAGSEQPFFLYLPLTSPHTPIVPSKMFKGKSGLNLYADYVMQTDYAVGRVLEALEAAGVTENTLVVFTADNGCSPRADFEFLGSKGHDPSYIFRGMKSDIYEGGHHVGCFVRWPKAVKPHTVKQTVCTVDFMATFAAVSGYELADNEAEDSYNLLPLLVNEEEPAPIRPATVHHSMQGHFAIRQGKWKLITTNYSGGWGEPTKDSDQCYKEPYQLYDLEADPREEHNVYNDHRELAGQMLALLSKYVEQGRSTPGAPQKNDAPGNWPQLKGWFKSSQQ